MNPGKILLEGSTPVPGLGQISTAAQPEALEQASSVPSDALIIVPVRKDLEEVPQQARQQLEFVFLDNIEDAMRVAINAESAIPMGTPTPPSA